MSEIGYEARLIRDEIGRRIDYLEGSAFGARHPQNISARLAELDRLKQFSEAIIEQSRWIAAIEARGYRDGRQAGNWLELGMTAAPGRMTQIQRFIKGIEDGDPEILDQLPQPRIGGEFADDPTFEDICKDELGEYTDAMTDLDDNYIHSFQEGVADEITAQWNRRS